MTLPRYRFSGTIPPTGLLQGLLVGALAASLLGAAYGWLSAIALPGLMQTVLAASLGAATGYFTAMPMVLGNVRHPWLVACSAAATATLAHLSGWALWIATELVNRGEAMSLGLLSPVGAIEFVSELNRRGTWALGSWPFGGTPATAHGWFLAFVWFAEAALVVGAAAWVGYRVASSTPYCEACGRWCWLRRGALFRHAALPTARRLLHAPTRDWVHRLLSLPPARTTDRGWLQVDLHECRRCGQALTLTVHSLAKGLPVLRRKTLLRQGVLPPDALAAIKAGRHTPAPRAE